MQPTTALTLCLSLLSTVYANTEKTIFIAPPAITIPSFRPSIENLRLAVLTPGVHTSHRTELSVAFPSDQKPRGNEHWYLLHPLVEGQRYEVRVCWAATQPTEFWLDTYPINQVLETSALLSSLAEYSGTNQDNKRSDREYQPGQDSARKTSLLFLHVKAAADFYSTNATLMQDPPNVVVDIILDPFALNLLPESLLLTGVYIIIVAIIAWFASGAIYQWLHDIAQAEVRKPHED